MTGDAMRSAWTRLSGLKYEAVDHAALGHRMFSTRLQMVWGATLNDYIVIAPGVVFARDVLMARDGRATVLPSAVVQPGPSGQQPGVGRAPRSLLNEGALAAGQLDLWPEDD